VFAAGRPLPLIVGTPGPRGTGRAVAGGYVAGGRWGFASGAAYADWLIGGFRVPGDDGSPDRLLVAVMPADEVEIIDDWRVAGLQGSGSFDFRADEVLVPHEMTFERARAPGGAARCSGKKRTCSSPTRCRRCAPASPAARSTR
jgi:indole-3-acetate monooxygenase